MKALVLDTGVINRYCHPKSAQSLPIVQFFEKLISDHGHEVEFVIPLIAVYECRRAFVRGVRNGSIDEISLQRLEELLELYGASPLDLEVERIASEIWADARARGIAQRATADDRDLDFDVIVAAHARVRDGQVITGNVKDLGRFVPAFHWESFQWF